MSECDCFDHELCGKGMLALKEMISSLETSLSEKSARVEELLAENALLKENSLTLNKELEKELDWQKRKNEIIEKHFHDATAELSAKESELAMKIKEKFSL